MGRSTREEFWLNSFLAPLNCYHWISQACMNESKQHSWQVFHEGMTLYHEIKMEKVDFTYYSPIKSHLPVSVQVHLSVAPYWQNQANGALIAARKHKTSQEFKHRVKSEISSPPRVESCTVCETEHHHLGHPHLSELGKSMPSRMLSCLLPVVETTIRYLTLTRLTDSNCTACMPEYREGQRKVGSRERSSEDGRIKHAFNAT